MKKTKELVFRNGGVIRNNESWFLGGKLIEAVFFYKYLGMFFTPKLLWSLTQDKLSLQATKAMH